MLPLVKIQAISLLFLQAINPAETPVEGTELSLPLSETESWSCNARKKIDEHFSIMIEKRVLNTETDLRVGNGDDVVAHLYVYWQKRPGLVAEASVHWADASLEDTPLPPPSDLGFLLSGPKMKGGFLEFTSRSKNGIVVNVMRPTVQWLGYASWISVREADVLDQFYSDSGWDAVYVKGRKRTDKGAARLPYWPDVRKAHSIVRTELVSKIADPTKYCEANPIDWDSIEASEI